jgi:hypothetical protein
MPDDLWVVGNDVTDRVAALLELPDTDIEKLIVYAQEQLMLA